MEISRLEKSSKRFDFVYYILRSFWTGSDQIFANYEFVASRLFYCHILYVVARARYELPLGLNKIIWCNHSRYTRL